MARDDRTLMTIASIRVVVRSVYSGVAATDPRRGPNSQTDQAVTSVPACPGCCPLPLRWEASLGRVSSRVTNGSWREPG